MDHEGGKHHPPAPTSIRRADTGDALRLLLRDRHQRLLHRHLLPSCLCWGVTIVESAGNLGAKRSLSGAGHFTGFGVLDHVGLVSWAEPMPWGLCPLESRCAGEGGRAVTIEENPRLRESREAATDVNTRRRRWRRRRRGRRRGRVTGSEER